MMKVKTIDFEGMFKKYFDEWFEENQSRYKIEQIENMMGELYEQWLDTENAAISCAPRDYYYKYSTTDLIKVVLETAAKKQSVCDVMTGTIVDLGEDEVVYDALKNAETENQKAVLMGLLSEMDSDLPYDLYIHMVKTGDCEDEIREYAAERLKERADTVSDKLLVGVDILDDKTRLIIADIVAGQQGDERVFKLLTEIFRTGDSVELASNYLMKFGDDRALPMLTEYIMRDDINYVEFVEVRNAIEALGGEVEMERDFSEDTYYQLLKKGKLEE